MVKQLLSFHGIFPDTLKKSMWLITGASHPPIEKTWLETAHFSASGLLFSVFFCSKLLEAIECLAYVMSYLKNKPEFFFF